MGDQCVYTRTETDAPVGRWTGSRIWQSQMLSQTEDRVRSQTYFLSSERNEPLSATVGSLSPVSVFDL